LKVDRIPNIYRTTNKCSC